MAEKDRYGSYRDRIINAAVGSIGDVNHEVFLSPPTHKSGVPGIVECANRLIEKALVDNWDYLWIVELDVEVPEDAFRKLFDLNVDIALGYYPSHNDFNRLVVGFLDETSKIWYLPRNAVQGNILSGWVFAGAGCMLIKRRVLEGGIRFRLKEGVGQDILFMVDAQQAGFIAKVHGEAECGHLPEFPIPERLEVLDVGCGDNPRGDVNCDHNIGQTNEGGIQTGAGIIIDPKKIKNFVKCDAQFLPFRSRSFGKATSFQVIEHVEDPWLMLEELIRVSRSKVEVTCPHALSRFADLPFHQHHFTEKDFIKFFSDLSLPYEVNVSDWHGKPDEIEVEVFLR